MKDKAANLFLILITCIVPLIVNPFDVDFYYEPKIILIYIFCLLMLIYFFEVYKKKKIGENFIDYLAAAYLIIAFLSTCFSVDIARSMTGREFRYDGFATLASYVFIFIIASKFYTFKKSHVKFYIISVLIVSILAIMQNFGIDVLRTQFIRRFWGNADISTIGNRDFLGSYITLAMPIVVFLYMYTKKIYYLIASSVIYFAMLVSNTRSAYVAFVFYFSYLVYFMIRYKSRLKNAAVITLLFIAITFGYNFSTHGEFFSRVFSIGKDINTVFTDPQNDDSAGSSRMLIWNRAVKLLDDRPILGSGPDTFDIVFEKRFGNIYRAKIDKAHNEYLQTAVTMGIPETILYIAFLSLIIYGAFKKVNKNIYIVPILMSAAGYMIQAFFNISVVSVAPIYWAFLGIINNLTNCDS